MSDIKLAIQRLGEFLTRKAAQTKSEKIQNYYQNYYQSIFVEIHNMVEGPRYTLIRQEDYPRVMDFFGSLAGCRVR